MPFVTKLTLESGDRRRLDSVVDDIKIQAERKGAELKGPRPQSPDHVRIPQSKTLGPEGGTFDPWSYTVYTREIDIIGYEEFARTVAGRDFDEGIHVEAEIERQSRPGS